MNYDEYSSQDRKILSWDGEDYCGFVESFTIGELLVMFDDINYAPDSCDHFEDYGNCVVYNAAQIIYDYIWKGLKELGEDHCIGESFEMANAYLKALAALSP